MQLLTVVIPRLQKLQEEEESGRKVITQWTRYSTVALAVLQSTGIGWLMANGRLTGGISNEWERRRYQPAPAFRSAPGKWR